MIVGQTPDSFGNIYMVKIATGELGGLPPVEIQYIHLEPFPFLTLGPITKGAGLGYIVNPASDPRTGGTYHLDITIRDVNQTGVDRYPDPRPYLYPPSQ